MSKKKPTSVKDWEKVCENLNAALKLTMDNETALQKKIEEMEKEYDSYFSPEELEQEVEELEAQVEQLEEQLTMSVGVIKYLEMKLERTD
jgi:polyhydroxyalkanoate synthesis regulator phasin